MRVVAQAKPAPDLSAATVQLRVAYAIQNVGGIDLSQDVGDTVPVKQTLLGLRRAGHEVSCLMLRKRDVVAYDNVANLAESWTAPQGISGRQFFRELESGARRIQVKTRLPYLALFDSLRFYEALSQTLGRYDLCHEHNGLLSVGTALACKRVGIPYVLTVSADPIFERQAMGRPLRGPQKLLAAREAAFTYRQARKILCVSETAKNHLVSAWDIPAHKVVVMPNGVDTGLFAPGADPRPTRARWQLGERPVVAFVGGFQPWHGLELLVEAMGHVRRHVPDARLLLVGDGRARHLVDEAIAKHGMETETIVTGLVPQAEVPGILAAVDVAVMPYPRLPAELWFSPLKMYEYMAAGKAIVATRAGQVADVLEDGRTALLVEPGDVGELARSITDLLRDAGLRRQLGRAARLQAVMEHSWDRYIRRLESIYASVLP